MKLVSLIESLPNFEPHGDLDTEISGISDNSRKIIPGSLFVAIKGLTSDSHKLIPQAIKAGATAVVGQEDLELDVPYIQVKNSREALGHLASTLFGNPSKKLKVIGVTGTEGKTTTCDLIYHIFEAGGFKTGLISTIGAKIAEKSIDTGLHVTNPEALPLQELLSKMLEEGCEYAVLETTSIGLDQGRVAGVKYHTGILTNINSDHLNYHKTLEAYREAKVVMFKNIEIAVLNKDDNSFEHIKDHSHQKTKVFSYGVRENADFKAENLESSAKGTKFDLYHNGQQIKLKTNLLGTFNVSNVLAAVATAIAHNIPFKAISIALEGYTSPEGRLERVDEGQGFEVFVDFAHTAGAVKNVLQTLRDITPKDNRLIALYGAAGLRDAEKRPEMGMWGAKLADITIFTMDDPRTENVDDIIDKIVSGALETDAQEMTTKELTGSEPVKQHVFIRIPDRREAIEFAINLAKPGDIVALLGKGHEKSLAVGNKEIPWSDQEVAIEALKLSMH